MSFQPGDQVVLREIWNGRVWTGRPLTVVRDDPATQMFFTHRGMRWQCPRDPEGGWMRLPADDWTLDERASTTKRALSFAWPDTPYSIIAYWNDLTDAFLCWYVNIQTPLRRTDIGFDYMDHTLDIIIEPNGSWMWKDEDELAEAVERGIFTDIEADAFYATGDMALERMRQGAPPFDEDWSTWRPDPDWPVPDLPEDWESYR